MCEAQSLLLPTTPQPTTHHERTPSIIAVDHVVDVEKVYLAPDASANVVDEAKSILALAFPLVLTTALELLPFAISVMLVGHIDSPLKKEYVDASSMSMLVMSMTGVSVGFGLASALDTLCSQTVGAGNLFNLGMYFQCGLIVLGATCVPMFILNFNAEIVLSVLHQDPSIVALASGFNKIAVVGMPGLFLYELMKKCLQAQGIVTPMVVLAALDNLLYAILGYIFCYHTSMGFYGAAIARSICYLLLPVFGYLYLCWNPVHKLWWPADHSFASQWKNAWAFVPEFLDLGVPGMLMRFMESLAFNLSAIMVGWMANPVLSLAVHNVLVNINAQIFAVYIGMSMACSIRVGTALGANEPNRARAAAYASIVTVLGVIGTLALLFVATHNYLPQLFISDPVAIQAVQDALAVFVIFMLVDGVNLVCQGILRAMGLQSIGAYVNCVAYYLVGLPLVALVGFHFRWGVQGAWFGLTAGLGTSMLVYLAIIYRTDWRQVAIKAVMRSTHNIKV
ncbi:Aste57867_1097 [Aphanomyces stellatus]|uniref:Aste57867_1097 protein n=1 Tax=Aphanomyces stellatus TaxID=120398 RepID=A0A485K6Z6_9STRA|nr:hypothetical protein As57867_001096 [Aphanomyces stellatus]VFT78319.1 Aste57867_1097 [Aphanomyces stellatus]